MSTGSSRYADLPQEAYFPFSKELVVLNGVVTLEGTPPVGPTTADDVAELATAQVGSVGFGAADRPIHPFVVGIHVGEPRPKTAADYLHTVCAGFFRTDHVDDLSATSLPFAGYLPGTPNDEVHTDPSKSYLFDAEHAPSAALHERLRGLVIDQHVWYILLHCAADRYAHDGTPSANNVFLLAVGNSIRGRHLIGVIGTQVCHNLCD